MGHVISHGKEYQLLQQRLSQKVQGVLVVSHTISLLWIL
jgi:hypothetical protein